MDSNYGSPGTPIDGDAARTPPRDTLKTKVADEAKILMNKAGSEARSRIDSGRREAAYTLSSVASSLQQSGGQLRSDQQNLASDYVQRTADQIDRFARYVENKDVGEIVTDVEKFARERPAVFLGAAFALGIVAARFLKSTQGGSSRQHRYELYEERQVPTHFATEPLPVPDSPWNQPSSAPPPLWTGDGDEA